MFTDPIIKKTSVAVLAVLGLFLLGKAMAEWQSLRFTAAKFPVQSTITVVGKGEVITIPDLATFTFGVTDESLIVPEAQERVTKRANEISAFLRERGVEEKDIKTLGYSIYPRYEYPPVRQGYYPPSPGTRELAAYVVSQTIEVRVRKIADAGKILGGIGELGATDIESLRFSSDKEDEFRREARGKAIEDARRQAKVLAGDLGVRIIRLVSFSEVGGFPTPFIGKFEGYGRGGDAPVEAPEVTPGETKIISQVHLTFEIR